MEHTVGAKNRALNLSIRTGFWQHLSQCTVNFPKHKYISLDDKDVFKVSFLSERFSSVRKQEKPIFDDNSLLFVSYMLQNCVLYHSKQVRTSNNKKILLRTTTTFAPVVALIKERQQINNNSFKWGLVIIIN